MTHNTTVIVCAYNECERLEATLTAIFGHLPGARVLVADDASTDATAEIARHAGVEVVTAPRNLGKGGTATLAAARVLGEAESAEPPVFVLCDADLGETARDLAQLAGVVRRGETDLAVGIFARKAGGGFGLALGFARWAIRDLTGLELRAPISGQRALSAAALRASVPFAPRFGMEIGMTVDVARAGLRVSEVQLEFGHRATNRDWGGFVHRGRQLADFLGVYASRRRRGGAARSTIGAA